MGLQQALNYGIRPGLSVDNGTAYSIGLPHCRSDGQTAPNPVAGQIGRQPTQS
jgi:hypothetical protein